MLPFLLQSPFPQTKCTGTYVERGSKAFTKFSKGVQSQESIKYWAAVRNKPTRSWQFGTPLCACEGKEGERRGARHNRSVQTAQLHTALRSPKILRQEEQERQAKGPEKTPVLSGRPKRMSALLPCPTKTRKSTLGKAGWPLHLNYSVIKTSNSQGRQEKIHALTHKVVWLELVSQDCCKGRAW